MFPFIETIKIWNGEVKNLPFHQARFNRTRNEMLGLTSHPALSKEIIIPTHARNGLFKCRILYDHQVTGVEFQPYERAEIRSLKLIDGGQVSYPYKSTDRSALTALYDQRDSCDDILILKDGRITDSYFANVVFWNGSNWVTPEFPLLEGTMRAFLLGKGIIKTAGIRIKDLSGFKSLKLINALNDWSDAPHIPVESVTW
ncbi:MAG: aminotransferase class IV family protein [Bacteroidales bacterium]